MALTEQGRFKTLGEFLSLFPRVLKTGDGYNVPCPAHSDSKPSLHISEHESKILLHCHAGCHTTAILNSLNITAADLFLNRNGQSPEGRAITIPPEIVATYDYQDADGTLLYQVVRYEPKTFRQRRPDGKDWIWDMKGVKRVLYRLPQILTALTANGTIYCVEGEKDADTLIHLGLCATTNVGGAGNPP